MRRTAVASCLLVVTMLASGCGSASTPSGRVPTSAGRAAADRFLAHYLTTDGRVIRRDQGGDIVSEGQAYGMLLAEVAGRPATVRTIWHWTRTHLLRGDGLLSYHASGAGRIEDANPATDADVLGAYALLRYRGSGQADMHAAGRRMAGAVLAHEAAELGGAPVLVAGPWAMATSTRPPTVNPSYWMPGVFTALARKTGDRRWERAATTAVSLVRQVTGDGRSLPPDWAQLSGGRLVPIAAPDGSAPVQYGLDAARLPVWFGTACTPQARNLAGRWWTRTLSVGGRGADLALSLTGRPIDRSRNPLPLMAAAAAAAAAGDRGRSAALRSRAARQSRQVPTYYGDAWLALGGALLGRSLDPCRGGSP